MDATAYRVVLVTCPDEINATDLARHLVAQRLAACVTRLPGAVSVYTWQDETTETQETLLLIKTTAAAYPALQQAILAQHPYQTPEIIALPLAEGLPPYLRWVDESTQPV